MPDDPMKRGPADRERISLLEPHEVEHWSEHFGVSADRLKSAVHAAGHMVADVAAWLEANPE